MVIYSFVGISGPLKPWLLIEKKKKKGEEGERKIKMKLSKF